MFIWLPFIVSLQIFKLVACESKDKPNDIKNSDKKSEKLPLVINTWAFTEANIAACKVLEGKPQGNALDALVAGCTRCEQLQCDGTVGFGGSPDERGETTLDALIMDGKDLNIGAVASMRQIKDAIKVAKHVLEHTEHSLLVGDAATDFAVQMGFKRESLITDKSFEIFHKWRLNKCQPNFWKNVSPDPHTHCGPYTPLSNNNTGRISRLRHHFGKYNHDTIGMIVIDEEAKIFAGTSTNGARHKIPGRVGDSPIPGAGAYADNTVGAAVATGDGDVMMRFLPSFMAVEEMRQGKSPREAAQNAIARISKYYPKFSGGLIAANSNGDYGAACAGMTKFPVSVAQGTLNNATRIIYVDCLN